MLRIEGSTSLDSEFEIYFAYGSNMSSARLFERIPSARSLGAARLEGFRLAGNKLGSDGTGKANLVVDLQSVAWGVIYALPASEWPRLDRFEPGYLRQLAKLRDLRDQTHAAQLYLAQAPGPDLPMHPWYREHLIEGAREHELPSDYIAWLSQLPIS